MADAKHDDPSNWTRGPLKLYFAIDDPRLLVRKFNPAFGWTFNFAHPVAPVLILLTLLVPAAVAAGR